MTDAPVKNRIHAPNAAAVVANLGQYAIMHAVRIRRTVDFRNISRAIRHRQIQIRRSPMHPTADTASSPSTYDPNRSHCTPKHIRGLPFAQTPQMPHNKRRQQSCQRRICAAQRTARFRCRCSQEPPLRNPARQYNRQLYPALCATPHCFSAFQAAPASQQVL